MFCADGKLFFRSLTNRLRCQRVLVLLGVYFIDHQHDWFLRFAQHPRQFPIEWRQAFLSVENEKEKIALTQRVFGGVPTCWVSSDSPAPKSRLPSVNGRSPRVQVAESRSRVIPG